MKFNCTALIDVLGLFSFSGYTPQGAPPCVVPDRPPGSYNRSLCSRNQRFNRSVRRGGEEEGGVVVGSFSDRPPVSCEHLMAGLHVFVTSECDSERMIVTTSVILIHIKRMYSSERAFSEIKIFENGSFTCQYSTAQRPHD